MYPSRPPYRFAPPLKCSRLLVARAGRADADVSSLIQAKDLNHQVSRELTETLGEALTKPPEQDARIATSEEHQAAGNEKVLAYIDLRATHAEPSAAYYPVPVQLSFSRDIRGVRLARSPKEVQVRLRKLGEK